MPIVSYLTNTDNIVNMHKFNADSLCILTKKKSKIVLDILDYRRYNVDSQRDKAKPLEP